MSKKRIDQSKKPNKDKEEKSQELELKEVVGKLVSDLDVGIKASFVNQVEKILENLDVIQRINIEEAKEILVEDDEVEVELEETLGIDPENLPKTLDEFRNLPGKVKSLLKVLYDVDVDTLTGGTEDKEIPKEIREIPNKLQNLSRSIKAKAAEHINEIFKNLGDELDEEVRRIIYESFMNFVGYIDQEIETIVKLIKDIDKQKRKTFRTGDSALEQDIANLIREKVKEKIARKRLLALRKAYSEGVPRILPVQGKVVFKAFIEPQLEKGTETQQSMIKIKIKPPSKVDADRPEGKDLSEIEIQFRMDLP